MSVRKLTTSVLAALAMLAGATSISAQEVVPPADPFAFDPDFRWFEPVYDMDLDCMKPNKRASSGWFATYDRLHLFVTRPELNEPNISEVLLDGGWGHRYEIGYMLPDADSGWMFNWTSNSVAESDLLREEALNRYNGDQVEGGSGGGFPTGPPFGEIVPEYEQNVQGYNYRFYDVTDSENILSFNSYELNKTWRMEPYHYGGILEPLVGFRWLRLNDANIFQTYQSTFDLVNPLVIPGFPGAAEQLTTNSAYTENEMIAAQLGFRYFKFRNRFIYSSEFRVFTGGNFQSSVSQTSETTYIYDFTTNAVTIGAPMEAVQREETARIYRRNQEYFVGFDVRGEVGYQLTKMIAIRGGFQVIDIARGVWRGGAGDVLPGGDNDQDVLMFGATFGLTLNR